MTARKSSKVLTDKQSILKYIDITADHLIKFLLQQGLPVLILNGRWYAHTDNLDTFMQNITAKHAVVNLKNGDNIPG